MNNLIFLPEGWEDYTYWQEQDKKTRRRIDQLIKNIARTPKVIMVSRSFS